MSIALLIQNYLFIKNDIDKLWINQIKKSGENTNKQYMQQARRLKER